MSAPRIGHVRGGAGAWQGDVHSLDLRLSGPPAVPGPVPSSLGNRLEMEKLRRMEGGVRRATDYGADEGKGSLKRGGVHRGGGRQGRHYTEGGGGSRCDG